jgi:hypothetical protein
LVNSNFFIQTTVHGSCFLPRTLVLSLPGSLPHIFHDLHQIWWTCAVGTIAKSHLARYTIPDKRM